MKLLDYLSSGGSQRARRASFPMNQALPNPSAAFRELFATLKHVLPEHRTHLLFLAGPLMMFYFAYGHWPLAMFSLKNLGTLIGKESYNLPNLSVCLFLTQLTAFLMLTATFGALFLAFGSARNSRRQFWVWVFVPWLLGLASYAGAYLFLRVRERSVLSPIDHRIDWHSAQSDFWATLLQPPFGLLASFLTVGVIAWAVFRAKQGPDDLPVRYGVPFDGQDSQPARKVIWFLLWLLLMGLSISGMTGIGLYFFTEYLGRDLEPRHVALWQTVQFALTACVTLLSFLITWGRPQWRPLINWNRPADERHVLFAIAAPAVVLAGCLLSFRFWQAVAVYFHVGSEFDRYRPWEELLPSPNRWMLLVFLFAFLIEAGWRGLVQAKLIEIAGVKRGLFLACFLYAILESKQFALLYRPVAFLDAFLMALLLGVVFLKTRTIWIPVLLHGAYLLMTEAQGIRFIFGWPESLAWIYIALLAAVTWWTVRTWPPDEAVITKSEPDGRGAATS